MERSGIQDRNPLPRISSGLQAEIYDWFTEGFDPKDLHEAKALLEELSEGQRLL